MTQSASAHLKMDSSVAQAHKQQLAKSGWLHVPSAVVGADFQAMLAAADRLHGSFPHGFVNKGVYAGVPQPRAQAPKPTDYAPTIIFPNAGFMEPDLLRPLADPAVHELIASVVGTDYYLSNSWLQTVPPGTGRLAYHKDLRGSVTFVVMLDEIGDNMGSTCLVPGTHINSPPANFCMDNPQKPHSEEIDMCGKPGDLAMFSPETWHARADNLSSRFTRRVFFNFYSRATKPTTSWANGVAPEQVQAARASLPARYGRLFDIEPNLTASLQEQARQGGSLDDGARSHAELFADIRHSRRFYGRSVLQAGHAGYTMPYTTRLMEGRSFSLLRYLRQLNAVPTGKIAIKAVLGRKPQAAPNE